MVDDSFPHLRIFMQCYHLLQSSMGALYQGMFSVVCKTGAMTAVASLYIFAKLYQKIFVMCSTCK